MTTDSDDDTFIYKNYKNYHTPRDYHQLNRLNRQNNRKADWKWAILRQRTPRHNKPTLCKKTTRRHLIN